MKALVTGSTGFVGGYLVSYLLEQSGLEVHGTVFKNASATTGLTVHQCDVTSKDQVYQLINTLRPDYIFHLAAQSYVNSSWENPEQTLHTNIIGQSNLLEAIRAHKTESYNPTVVIACSSEEYGPHDAIDPLTEQSPLKPQSPYAISKIGQDFMGFQYFASYGLNVIRLRLFNHTGPGRDPVFGVSNFCKKIAEIEAGKRALELTIRDLSAVRDFTDVRDVSRAYWLAAQKCTPGEVYNVCSGQGVSFKTILDRLLALTTVKNIALTPDPAGPRPTDGGVIVGDYAKFKQATTWQPEVQFIEKTIADMLDYWRLKIK